jgi:hypothetical protein
MTNKYNFIKKIVHQRAGERSCGRLLTFVEL